MFINIGKEEFEIERRGEYVDKSMLISFVNGRIGMPDKFLCVTRARRFGKSIAAKMLNAYYDESVDSRALFADLKIAKEPSFEKHLNKYPVIYLDVSGFTGDLEADPKRVVNMMNHALSDDLIEIYHEVSINKATPLYVQLKRVVDYTHKPFIMIIDEWDAVFREIKDETVKKKYVGWLRTLFKNAHTNKIFAGVYMTGILPIKQYNTESTLNNFEEFTMTNPGDLGGYFGFTSAEVSALCKKYKMDQELIKQWYDGYLIGDVHEIYNPYAVMALTQIKENRYAESLCEYVGEVVLVGVNYDKKTKKHTCHIEQIKYELHHPYAQLTTRQRKIVEWIKEHPKVSYEEMANALGVSRPTIIMDFYILQELDIIQGEGKTRGKIWKVISDVL